MKNAAFLAATTAALIVPMRVGSVDTCLSFCKYAIHAQSIGTNTSGNSSRPDRIAGETHAPRYTNVSAGHLKIGDIDYAKTSIDPALVTDILAGAARVFQTNEYLVDREIAEFVSANFESYWD